MNKYQNRKFFLPSYESEYEKNEGDVSLSLSLFRLAPPAVAMKMMQEDFITNLDELDINGVSLLATKYKQSISHLYHYNSYDSVNYNDDDYINFPTWKDWEENKYQLWDDYKDNNHDFKLNHQVLVASMIFAGANPWVEWDHLKYDNISTSFFNACFYRKDTGLIQLLLSHPNCPDTQYFENQNLMQSHIQNGGGRQVVSIEKTPLMHYAVNKSNKQLVDLLLNKGLDINSRDELGRTPVFYCVEKEVFEYLIQKGAKINIKDKNDQTPALFWRNWFNTAAKLADFNKIVIEKMKDEMTPEELRENQKPALFNELYKGTKGGFEAIYRKSKFKPDVIFDKGVKGKWDIITTAIMRDDDRTSMFIDWGLKKGLSWSHTPWEDKTNVDNAMLLTMITNVGSGESYQGLNDYLFEKYRKSNDVFKDFAKDALDAIGVLSKSKTKISKSILFYFSLLMFDQHKSKIDETNSYAHRGVERSLKHLYNVANILDPQRKLLSNNASLSPPLNLDLEKSDYAVEVGKSLFNTFLESANKKFEKLSSQNIGHSYSNYFIDIDILDILFDDLLIKQKKQGNDKWLSLSPLLFAISIHAINDKDYFNSPTKGHKIRETISELLKDIDYNDLNLTESELANIHKTLVLKAEKNETVPVFKSLLSSMEIQSGINQNIDDKNKVQVRKRKI